MRSTILRLLAQSRGSKSLRRIIPLPLLGEGDFSYRESRGSPHKKEKGKSMRNMIIVLALQFLLGALFGAGGILLYQWRGRKLQAQLREQRLGRRIE